MAEEKESTSVPLSQVDNGGQDPEDPVKSPPSSPNSSTRKVWILFTLFYLCRLFFVFYLLAVALFAYAAPKCARISDPFGRINWIPVLGRGLFFFSLTIFF